MALRFWCLTVYLVANKRLQGSRESWAALTNTRLQRDRRTGRHGLGYSLEGEGLANRARLGVFLRDW